MPGAARKRAAPFRRLGTGYVVYAMREGELSLRSWHEVSHGRPGPPGRR